MYRLLVILVLLSVIDSSTQCHGRFCEKNLQKSSYNHYPENMFYKSAHWMISLERKFQNYCRDNMMTQYHEVFGNSSYVVKLLVPGFQAKDLAVKVMYKALYIHAQRWDLLGRKNFWHLQMLPDNLKSEEASWNLKDSQLEISFPYSAQIGEEVNKTCGNIMYYILTVPMAKQELDEGWTSEIDTLEEE